MWYTLPMDKSTLKNNRIKKLFTGVLFTLFLLLLPAGIVQAQTVFYDGGAGIVSAAQETDAGGMVTLTRKAFRKGYVLKSWNTVNGGGGIDYRPGTTIRLDQDTTLYAVWKKKNAKNLAKLQNAYLSGMDALIGGAVSFETEKKDAELALVTVNQETEAIEYLVERFPEPGNGGPVSFQLPLTGGQYHLVLDAVRVVKGRPTEETVALHFPVCRVGLAAKCADGVYRLLGNSVFLSDADQSDNEGGYIEGSSKKGIQGDEGAEELNVGHVFLNLYASQIVGGTSPYTYNGKTYGFDTTMMNAILTRADQLKENGIAVTLQIMLDYGKKAVGNGKTETAPMVHSKARKNGQFLYSWENREKEGREMIEAMFSYISEALMMGGTPHISEVILGNEVNSYKAYQYKGSMSKKEFYTSYAETYRLLYNSVKSMNPKARVFICLDHGWNENPYGYPARSFLTEFNKRIRAIDQGIHWDLAFHPYANPLELTEFWNGKGATDSLNTKYITMKNINVLTRYLDSSFPYAHLILSELGYTSGDGSEAAQELQAEALRRTYQAVQTNAKIDSVMIRSYYDDPNDGILMLGLKFADGREKKAYQVWKEL